MAGIWHMRSRVRPHPCFTEKAWQFALAPQQGACRVVSRAQQGLSWGLMSPLQALGISRTEWSSCAMLCPVAATHSRPSSESQLQPCRNKQSKLACAVCSWVHVHDLAAW